MQVLRSLVTNLEYEREAERRIWTENTHLEKCLFWTKHEWPEGVADLRCFVVCWACVQYDICNERTHLFSALQGYGSWKMVHFFLLCQISNRYGVCVSANKKGITSFRPFSFRVFSLHSPLTLTFMLEFITRILRTHISSNHIMILCGCNSTVSKAHSMGSKVGKVYIHFLSENLILL